MNKTLKKLRRKASMAMTGVLLRMWMGNDGYRRIKELNKQYIQIMKKAGK